jgi:hypothetical protein
MLDICALEPVDAAYLSLRKAQISAIWIAELSASCAMISWSVASAAGICPMPKRASATPVLRSHSTFSCSNAASASA